MAQCDVSAAYLHSWEELGRCGDCVNCVLISDPLPKLAHLSKLQSADAIAVAKHALQDAGVQMRQSALPFGGGLPIRRDTAPFSILPLSACSCCSSGGLATQLCMLPLVIPHHGHHTTGGIGGMEMKTNRFQPEEAQIDAILGQVSCVSTLCLHA